MHPRYLFVDTFACHEERIVVQPIAVALTKSLESAALRVSAVRKKSATGFAKQILFKGDDASVLDLLLRKTRRVG